MSVRPAWKTLICMPQRNCVQARGRRTAGLIRDVDQSRPGASPLQEKAGLAPQLYHVAGEPGAGRQHRG